MNQFTFNLIDLKTNFYYKDQKLNHYLIEIFNEIENNKINILVNNIVEGQINIEQ